MESNGNLIWMLAFVTLIVVVAVAIWQRGAVARAKEKHEHSAMTAGRPDLRKSDGSDPGTKPH